MRGTWVEGLAWGVIGVSLLGCCSPSRDNPFDPANAPRAQLSFADATAANGGCLPPGQVSGPSILEIDRGRCLGLVGTGSFDPQDPVSQLSFRWDLVTSSNQDPATSGAAPLASSTGQPVAVLGSAAVRSFLLPVDAVLTLQLTVGDSAGRSAETRAQLLVHNLLPEPFHIPVRAVGIGGPPWNPGTAWTVPLAIPVSDPDGDPLASICWDRPPGPGGGTVCSSATPPDPFDPSFVLTVPPSPGEVVATLRASDGVTDTTLGRSIVRVRPPSTWTTVGGLGGPLQRVDVGRRDFVLANVLQLRPVRGPQGALTHLLVLQVSLSSSTLSTRTWPDFSGGSVAPSLGFTSTSEAVSPDGTTAYLAANVGNSTGIQLYPYTISAGTLTAGTPSAVIPITTEGQSGTNPAVTVDSAGHIWVSQTWSAVYEVDSTGAVLGSWADPASGGRVFAMRQRPGTQEMWFVRTPPVNISGASPSLHRIASGTETVWNLGPGHSLDFAWVDGNTFWIGLESSMALVRADQLTAGSSFSAATLRTVPLGGVSQLAIDPTSLDVWGSSLQTFSVYRVALDGSVLTSSPGSTAAQFVDDAGSAWWYDSSLGRVVASEVPVTSPVAASDTTPLLAGGSGDGTGGLWTATVPLFGPVDLEHVAYDGTVLATVDHAVATSGGAIAPLPGTIDIFRVQPGGSTAWVVATDFSFTRFPPPQRLLTFDLSKPVPPESLIAGTSAGLQFSAPLLEPSAPIPGSTPFLWTAAGGSPGSVGQLTPQGVFTPLVAFSTNERRQFGAARSLRSNGLCMGGIDGTGFRSLWITPAGVATTLDSTTVTSGSSFPAAAVSPDSGGTGDICWATVQAPSSGCTFGAGVIDAWTPAGTLTASYTISPAGSIASIKPVDRFHVWATVNRCDANSKQTQDLEYLVNVAGSGTALTRLAVVNGGGSTFLDDEVSTPIGFFPTP